MDLKRNWHAWRPGSFFGLIAFVALSIGAANVQAQPQTIQDVGSACTRSTILVGDPPAPVIRPADNCTGANDGVYINSIGEAHRRAVAAFGNSLLDAGNALGPFVVSAVAIQGLGTNTTHDGLTASFNPTFDMPDHEDTDFTVTLSFSYDVGRRRLGGQKDVAPRRSKFWQIGGFVGYQTLETELGNTVFTSGLGLGGAGSARNNAVLVGGYSLMAWKNFYTFSTISGTFGQTEDFNTALAANSKYDTDGYVSSSAIGYVMTLGQRRGAKDGGRDRNLKLDARAELSSSKHFGDAHVNSAGFRIGESRVESVTGGLSLTLFSEIRKGDAIIKPYIKGGIQQRFDHDNTVIIPTQVIQGNTINRTEISFDEEDTFVTVEGGLSIARKKGSLNGSAFYQGSGDADIIGGRIGYNLRLGPN